MAMSDAELAVHLGIAGTKKCAEILAALTPADREDAEREADLVSQIKLWEAGLGALPPGVIACGRRRHR